MTTTAEVRTTATSADWLPAFFVLVAGLLFGGSMIFLTPPFNVPDEQGHWFRCYQCSLGEVYASRKGDLVGGELPESLQDVYLATIESAQIDVEVRISPEKFGKAMAIPLDPGRQRFFSFPAMARYSPVTYLPAATAIAVGRLTGRTPLRLFYLGRAGTLIGYLLLVVAAVWLMPVQKWTLALLGLMPMSIFLAASLSPDALSIALSLLGIAMILRWPCGRRRSAKAACGRSQPSSCLSAWRNRGTRRSRCCSCWSPRRSSPFHGSAGGSAPCWSVCRWRSALLGCFPCRDFPCPCDRAFNVQAQAHWMLVHPWTCTQVMMEKITEPYLYCGVIATLGWGSIFLASKVYAIYWIALLATAVLDGGRDEVRLPIWTRVAAVVVYFLIMILIAILTYLAWQAVGDLDLHGIQSRYFVPILPLLLLPLRGSRAWRAAASRAGSCP